MERQSGRARRMECVIAWARGGPQTGCRRHLTWKPWNLKALGALHWTPEPFFGPLPGPPAAVNVATTSTLHPLTKR